MFLHGKQLQFGKSGVYIFENGCQDSADDILRAMLGGVDVLFVDPKLYPSLLEYSDTFKNELLYKKQDDLAEKLDFFVNYMKEYPKREEYARLFKTLKNSSRKPQKEFTPDQLKSEVEYISRYGNTKKYTPKQTQEIVYEFVKRKQEALKKKDFSTAEDCDFIMDSLTKASQLNTVKEVQTSQIRNYNQRVNKAKTNSETIKMKWENLILACQRKRNEDIASIHKKYEEEYRKIEEEKRKEPPISRMRPSGNLLNLRRQEIALVQTKNYKGAEKIKALADDLEIQEKEKFIFEWRANIDEQLRNLQKQESQLVANRQIYWQTEENTIRRDMNSELDVSEKRLDFLNNELVQVKAAKRETMSALNGNRLPSISSAPVGQTRNSCGNTAVRTSSSVHNYFTDKVSVKQTPGEFRHRAMFNMRVYTATPRKRLSSTI